MTWIDGGEWNSVRGKELVSLISNAFIHRAELEKLVDDSGVGRDNLPEEMIPPKLQWHGLLTKLQKIGKMRSLIATIMADTPGLADELNELSRDDPGQNVGNPRNAYDVRLIGPKKRPMINRRELRDNVKELFGDQRVVLTVRGPGKSGKSYSYLLITHVASSRDDRRLHWFNFAPPGTGDNAMEILATICSRLGIEDVTKRPKWTTATTFAGQMVDDFVGPYRDKFEHDGTTRILVIDGLERFEPGSDVYVLAARLGLEAAMGGLPKTQLVLLGYAGPFDPAMDFALLDEEVKGITATDLLKYFEGLAEDVGCEITADRLAELASEAMTGDPSVAALSERVHKQVRGLIGGA